jgi:hypothetical protein
MPWAVYFWPGLPQLVGRGSWAALWVALAAAAVLSGMLLGSCVWTDVIAPDMRIICWMFLGITWSVAAGISLWSGNCEDGRSGDPQGDLFPPARDEYLKGNWFEAERILGQLLRRNPRDLESRLMLATLLRHTKRFDEAVRQLSILVRLDGAPYWASEIRREGELLAQARQRTITSVNPELANYGDH